MVTQATSAPVDMSWQVSPGCGSLCSLLGKTGHPLLLQQYLLALWKLDSNNETSQWLSVSFLHEEQIFISWGYFAPYYLGWRKKKTYLKQTSLENNTTLKHRENQFLLTLPRFETWNLFKSQNEKHQDSKSVYWFINEVWIANPKTFTELSSKNPAVLCSKSESWLSLWEGSP